MTWTKIIPISFSGMFSHSQCSHPITPPLPEMSGCSIIHLKVKWQDGNLFPDFCLPLQEARTPAAKRGQDSMGQEVMAEVRQSSFMIASSNDIDTNLVFPVIDLPDVH